MRLNRLVVVGTCLFSLSLGAQSDRDTREAARHYRVAQEALKDDNLTIASEELTQALSLTPANALVNYYLAIVQSKQGDSDAALKSIERAMAIGLPPKESQDAEELLATTKYAIRKKDQSGHALEWLVGTWWAANTDDRGPWKPSIYTFSRRVQSTRIMIISKGGEPNRLRVVFRLKMVISIEETDGHHSYSYNKDVEHLQRSHEVNGTGIYEGTLSVDQKGEIIESDLVLTGCEGTCDTSFVDRSEFFDPKVGGSRFIKQSDTGVRLIFSDGTGFRDYNKR
jgi:tetratricopeptide (TPR) repeat protein